MEVWSDEIYGRSEHYAKYSIMVVKSWKILVNCKKLLLVTDFKNMQCENLMTVLLTPYACLFKNITH